MATATLIWMILAWAMCLLAAWAVGLAWRWHGHCQAWQAYAKRCEARADHMARLGEDMEQAFAEYEAACQQEIRELRAVLTYRELAKEQPALN